MNIKEGVKCLVNCNACQQEIHFDDQVRSKNGKKIPLQGAVGYDKHDCPERPYKGGSSKVAVPENNLILELTSRVGTLENKVNELLERQNNTETGLREFGEVIAKESFKKGSEV